MGTTTTDLAERVIATLRAHKSELRAAGILHLSLFGSVARGEDGKDSDVDLVTVIDPAARLGFGFFGLAPRISQLLDRPVDLIAEPVEKLPLKANIERDRRIVF